MNSEATVSAISTAFPLGRRVSRCRSARGHLVARAALGGMRCTSKSMPAAGVVVVLLACALLAGCPSGGSEPKNPPQAPPAPLKPAVLGQFVSADAGAAESAVAQVSAKDIESDAGTGPREHVVDAAAPPDAVDAARPPTEASQPSGAQ
jgi:hypothetical protein